ncbi:MAG: hypothetical protein WCF90_05030 [Methanomicrobiales archaeon]
MYGTKIISGDWRREGGLRTFYDACETGAARGVGVTGFHDRLFCSKQSRTGMWVQCSCRSTRLKQ